MGQDCECQMKKRLGIGTQAGWLGEAVDCLQKSAGLGKSILPRHMDINHCEIENIKMCLLHMHGLTQKVASVLS